MSKDLYRRLCADETDIPVFSRDWWLDVVCGDDWNALVVEEKGRVQAAMPLYTPCKNVVSMPHYTQTMGVWFDKSLAADAKYVTRLARRQSLCKIFIDRLEKYRCFLQCFSADFTDWLPFYWAGYSQTTRYTYILHGLNDRDALLSNMSEQIRRNLKKAQEYVINVRAGVTVDEFLRIQALTFERQGLRNRQSSDVLQRLISVARERGQGEVFGGYDGDGRLHAVAFVVWQSGTAYYIAGGGDPAFRNSGAHSLVMWEAIGHVSQYAKTFDFEGSMLPGVERFFHGFGAVQTPYFAISRGRISLTDKVCMKLRNYF